MPNPPVLWDIESDPALAGTKMIAEAWDAAGLYQVGSFVGDSWKEWNDRLRDDVRDFFRGANDSVGRIADRLLGSPSIYGQKEREAEESINFVTWHDGFTLNDVVSYNHKHYEENGEDNCDGVYDNRGWNCGVEGPSDDPDVEKLRNRQVKNFLTAAMLSGGVPMFVMGDEVRRSAHRKNLPCFHAGRCGSFAMLIHVIAWVMIACRFPILENLQRFYVGIGNGIAESDPKNPCRRPLGRS